MRKRVLGATLVAAGLAFQAMPASADKLDDVLSRLEAIEKNNAKLANENATLKARLNKVEIVKPKSAAPSENGPREASAAGLALRHGGPLIMRVASPGSRRSCIDRSHCRRLR